MGNLEQSSCEALTGTSVEDEKNCVGFTHEPQAALLASASEDAMPEVAHGEAKVGQGVPVARNSEVSEMPALLRIGFTPTHHPRMDAAQ